jgi:hypothetical protein
MRLYLVLFFLIVMNLTGRGQSPVPGLGFLMIEPDARGSAAGLIGVASSPDNFVFYNPAKLAMQPGQEYGISAGYVPYLRKLVKGIGLATIQGFRRMDEETAIGLDIRYFSLGEIQFKDETGYDIYAYNPAEWTIGLTYSRQLSEYSSIGFSCRYINSRPAAGIEYQGQEIKTASAIGADIGFYYSSIAVSELPGYTGGILRGGLSLANLGTKVKYHANGGSAFQPMTFRSGLSYTFPSEAGEHLFSVTGEISKLLLPPAVERDGNGNIIAGRDPENTNVPAAFFAGWGNMKSWGAGFGAEYLYQQRFFLRAGIHYESPEFSSKQLATLGAGFQHGAFHFDMSYFAGFGQQAGAQNYQSQTFKITLGVMIASE